MSNRLKRRIAECIDLITHCIEQQRKDELDIYLAELRGMNDMREHQTQGPPELFSDPRMKGHYERGVRDAELLLELDRLEAPCSVSL